MAWQGRLDSERYKKSGKIGEISLMKYKKANAKSFTWDKITPCSHIDWAQTGSKTGPGAPEEEQVRHESAGFLHPTNSIASCPVLAKVYTTG